MSNFGERTYTLVCHGCGKFHEVLACFLSSPMGYSFPGSEGSNTTWCIPALGCPECMAIGKDETDRSKKPIARAYDHGPSPETRERMNREWPAVRAKLEAAKKR